MTDEEIIKDRDRQEHILSNLLKLASGEFQLVELSEIKNDNLDAIDRGVVMLGEHLEANYREQEKYLQEKEDLLKEVHHRVKNNLQIVSSLLNLQANFTSSPEARAALKQSQYRIRSMSMIHEMLYKTDRISEVNYKDYIEKLTHLLIESIKGKLHSIRVNIDAPNVYINLDIAVTLGLLINEIITNSLIHGIDENGSIYIHFEKDEDLVFLKIGDNGKGITKENNAPKTLGIQLIDALTNQLSGTVSKNHHEGTHYVFTFSNTDFKL